MEELKLNYTYLLRIGSESTLLSATILMITDKAYHIQWNAGMESHNTWELNNRFNSFYSVVEDISDFVIEKNNITDPKTKFITCPVCKGFGTIPDEKTTGDTSPCPLCHGSKMILESIEA